MLSFSITIVLLALITIIHGLSLDHVENNKICTTWTLVTSSISIDDQSVCSSDIGYEMRSYMNQGIVRFCCLYKRTVEPEIGPLPAGCGRQAAVPLLSRIVGGKEAVGHSWPWIVSLQYRQSHFCGGTLIDDRHVLTAAHCLQDQSILNSGFTVVAGLHSQSRPNSNRVQRRAVLASLNHPEYNDFTNENDLAIIRLASPVSLNSYVNYICLPTSDPTVQEDVMIAGWGTKSFEGDPSDTLRQAQIEIMDSSICSYVYNGFIPRKQICAGVRDYSKDSCQGDSGGPLMDLVSGQWVLSGVVSYGDECAKFYRPGVYARVNYYLPWIRSTISRFSAL